MYDAFSFQMFRLDQFLETHMTCKNFLATHDKELAFVSSLFLQTRTHIACPNYLTESKFKF